MVELAYAQTSLGALTLRRRTDPGSGADVHEVRIDDDYLMSSLFTVAEVALADLALARLSGDALTVVVGGLGLGFTAAAALADPRVTQVIVVEALAPVISWHLEGLVPGGLAADPRCSFVHGDFFALVRENGFDPAQPGRAVDAVLLDVDHSPRHLLTGAPRPFYESAGTLELALHLWPGGVFGLWSDDPPDQDYLAVLREVFPSVSAEVVSFRALDDSLAANTVYLGTAPVLAASPLS